MFVQPKSQPPEGPKEQRKTVSVPLFSYLSDLENCGERSSEGLNDLKLSNKLGNFHVEILFANPKLGKCLSLDKTSIPEAVRLKSKREITVKTL